MEEEEVLNRITKFLEQGCTMLATHHSCGTPLFRCKGQIICPVCSSLQVDEAKASASVTLPERASMKAKVEDIVQPSESEISVLHSDRIQQNITQINDIGIAKNNLKAALLNKLRNLQIKMEEENDPERLYGVLECLEIILDILKILG